MNEHYASHKYCLSTGHQELLKCCPLNRGGIIWMVGYLLKYSDENFFGKVDTYNKGYGKNTKFVDDPMLIQYKVFELLTRLSSQVVRGQLYAHGKLRVSHKIKLYATVECTLDISAEDCKKCLIVAISELLNHSYRTTGGRAIYGSCMIRFEHHPFYYM